MATLDSPGCSAKAIKRIAGSFAFQALISVSFNKGPPISFEGTLLPTVSFPVV